MVRYVMPISIVLRFASVIVVLITLNALIGTADLAWASAPRVGAPQTESAEPLTIARIRAR